MTDLKQFNNQKYSDIENLLHTLQLNPNIDKIIDMD